MYKKIIFDKIILMLGLLFIFSCSNPNNPNSGDGGFTGPTEEELIKKYGIDIGQEDTEISKQIEANLKAYHDEMGSYRVIFTGTPHTSYDASSSLSALILEVAERNNINNIDVDIRNINFQNGTINEYMFSFGYNENISLNFIFPKDTIKIIKTMSFYYLSSLKNITIPNSVQLIEQEAFANCFQLEKLAFEEGITTIWASSFPAAEKLKELVLPSTLISIEDMALMNHGLTELTIPNSVKSIGNEAFSTSITLTKLTLPASLTSIGSKAFSACGKLTTVIYYGTSPDTINNKDALSQCLQLSTLIVPNATNPNDERWKTFLGGKFTDVRKE